MEYKIEGTPFPVLICNLTNGETMVTESGAMSWMTSNITMETSSQGGFGKMMGRVFAGESLFLNRYTANGNGMVAFASTVPGVILPIDIAPGNDMIVQKTGFLAAEPGVELSIFFKKKLGAGFFGGEGFIMQRLSGQGKAFIAIDGYCKEYILQPGQTITIDTGYLAAMESTCSMDIKMISGAKNVLFGGEGLFNTIVTGPGKVYLQTQPISKLAGAISRVLPSKG